MELLPCAWPYALYGILLNFPHRLGVLSNYKSDEFITGSGQLHGGVLFLFLFFLNEKLPLIPQTQTTAVLWCALFPGQPR